MTSTGDPGRGRRIGSRPTKAEQVQRLSQIHTLLINNLSRQDICRYVSEKTTWGLTERTIERYIAGATKMIRASAAFHRDQELGLAIAQVKDIYAKGQRIQDYKTSLSARKELSELLGLYAPKRLEVTGADGGPQEFIALIPQGPQDRDAWSRQCKQEQEQLERQRATASTASGGQ